MAPASLTSNREKRPRKAMRSFSELLLCSALTLCLTPPTRGFSRGASRSSCLDMKPGHISTQPQAPSRGFVILYTDTSSYLPGDTVAVLVRSTRDFMGFLLQARTVAKQQVAGSFVLTPPGSRLLGCEAESDTVTHADKLLKRNLSFVWKAPERPTGDVRFLITVVQSYFVYWAGIESTLVTDGTAKISGTEAASAQEGLMRTTDPGSTLPTGEALLGGGISQVTVTHDDGLFQTGTTKPSAADLEEHDMPTHTGGSVPLTLPPDLGQIGEGSQTTVSKQQDCQECKDSKEDSVTHETPLLPVSPEGGAVEPWRAQHSLLIGPDLDTTHAEMGDSSFTRVGPWSQATSSPPRHFDSGIMTLITRSWLEKAGTGLNVSRGGKQGPPKEEVPGKVPSLDGAQLGILLGMAAGLGMVLAAALRYLHGQYCWKRSEVSLGNSRGRGGVIHVQECGDLVQVRKIRQDSFVLLQAEYNVLTPPGN